VQRTVYRHADDRRGPPAPPAEEERNTGVRTTLGGRAPGRRPEQAGDERLHLSLKKQRSTRGGDEHSERPRIEGWRGSLLPAALRFVRTVVPLNLMTVVNIYLPLNIWPKFSLSRVHKRTKREKKKTSNTFRDQHFSFRKQATQ
jgi:hypothetical protein